MSVVNARYMVDPCAAQLFDRLRSALDIEHGVQPQRVDAAARVSLAAGEKPIANERLHKLGLRSSPH